MLVLKRKEGQSIIIGQKIVVKVVEIEGRSVKIGIEAPKDVNIVREELLQKAKEKIASASIKPEAIEDIRIKDNSKKEE